MQHPLPSPWSTITAAEVEAAARAGDVHPDPDEPDAHGGVLRAEPVDVVLRSYGTAGSGECLRRTDLVEPPRIREVWREGWGWRALEGMPEMSRDLMLLLDAAGVRIVGLFVQRC